MAIWQAEIKELGKLYESLKGQFPDLEKELKQLIRNEDANVIMLYSRRCLEVIITNLCECELKRDRKTEPLKGIIDKLQKEGKVPSHIISSMHGLNELSTYGAHPKDFDPEQIKPVLVNLDIIIKWYLKYKETGTKNKVKPVEEIRQEIKSTEDVKKIIRIPKKRLIGLVSGLILFIVVVFAVLFITKIIGADKQIKELEKSIAVLPFINDSPSDSTTYFVNGVMEEILNNLQKIKDFRILSRTSTERYRGTDIPAIPEIAKKLGVNYIVEGSGQKYGSTFRLRVQLIAANKERHLWAESYEKEIKETKDIFNIQNQIAQAIASQLKAIITPQEKQLIEKPPTKNLDAYNLYLQGRFFINKRTNEGFNKSIEYFEKAVAADPVYALAYAGLADAYFLLAFYNQTLKAESYARSKEYALRALSIDKNLAEAHTVLGGILTWNDWKWEDARKELQLAVELNPKFVTGHSYYSELLDILRENTEARKQIKLALEIDPYFPTLHVLSALYFLHEGKFKESMDGFKISQELYPGRNVYWDYFWNYIMLGDDIKALDAAEQALLRGDSLAVKYAGLLKDVYNKSGIKGAWTLLLEFNLKQSTPNPLVLASTYTGMDKKEEALNWLEKALENRSIQLPRINNDPLYESLRSEPRFQAIIKKMGLSEYARKE